MTPEGSVQEPTDPPSGPSPGVAEVCIKRKVALIKRLCFQIGRFGTEYGEVEDRQVEIMNLFRMPADKHQGSLRRLHRFRRRTEQEIDVRSDTGPPELLKAEGGLCQINPLAQAVQHPLVPRLEPHFEHDTT